MHITSNFCANNDIPTGIGIFPFLPWKCKQNEQKIAK